MVASSEVTVCMTLDYVGIAQSSVIWIIYCNVGLKRFFSFSWIFVIIISFLLTFIFHKVV